MKKLYVCMKFIHITFLSMSILSFSINGMAAYRTEPLSLVEYRTMSLSMQIHQQQQMKMVRQIQQQEMAMILRLQAQRRYDQNYLLFLQSTDHSPIHHQTIDENYQTYTHVAKTREMYPSPKTSYSSFAPNHIFGQHSMKSQSTQTDTPLTASTHNHTSFHTYRSLPSSQKIQNLPNILG